VIISEKEFYTLLDETNINITSCKLYCELIFFVSRNRLATMKKKANKINNESAILIKKFTKAKIYSFIIISKRMEE